MIRRSTPTRQPRWERRWAITVAVLAVLEVGAFCLWNADLVALTRSDAALAADPGFDTTADAILARPRVSRQVLERVAVVAERRGNLALQSRVLERIATAVPGDAAIHLRLADSLRAQGRHAEAEAMYRRQLTLSDGGAR